MKKALTIGSLALLALTGCSSATEKPSGSPTASVSESPTQATTQTTPIANATTPTETPVAAIPEATKKIFSGTTLKGNDIMFQILSQDDQQQLNQSVKGSGLTGSWGILCSEKALIEQLQETGVITTESGGQGHAHIWRPVKYATAESSNYSPEIIDQVSEMLSDASTSQAGNLKCVGMQTVLKSAAQQGFSSATVGRYMGNGQVIDTVEIY